MMVRASAVILLLMPAAAAAQPTAPPADWSWWGRATVMSDYRHRGFSHSGGAPAGAVRVGVDHAGGGYGEIAATSLTADGSLGIVQIDARIGWAGETAPGVTLDVGVNGFAYPDEPAGERSSHVEPTIGLSYLIGPVEVDVGAGYAIDGGAAVGGGDSLNLHAGAAAAIPGTPVTLDARIGRIVRDDVGAFADWRLGGSAVLGAVTLSAHYADTSLTDVSGTDATLIVSAALDF